MDSYPGAAKINFLGDNQAKGKVINQRGETKVKARVIDGFVKAPQASANLKNKVGRPATAAARGLHQRGQKAQTLMRGALKKPTPANRATDQRHFSNPQRELRAKQTVLHSKVERFGGFVSNMKTAEKTNKEPLLQGEVISRQVPRRAKSAAPSTVMPSMVTSASHQRLERMLDEALTKADAHKQALKYHAARHFWQRPGFFNKRRWTKLSILIIGVLAASLFVAWQKMPQLSLKLAAMRTHVDASVPSYAPAGYSFSGPAKALNHAVAIQYTSPGNQSYTVQEQASDQDSSSLIADSTSPGQQLQTTQANGIPIVITKKNVKCVSNGVETTITKANLSPDELLNIAKGICS